MAELIPQDGIVEVRGALSVDGPIFSNGQPILQYDKLGKLRIVAVANINASTPKVVVINPIDGYSITTGYLKGNIFSNYAEKVIGIATSTIPTNGIGEVIGRGIIIANGFDATSASVGDNVYVDSGGNFTLTTTQLLIGNVASASNPGVLYIDVNSVNSPYLIGQSTIPVGSVYAYLGTVAPAGYLLCNGSSQLVANYSDLHGVIGYNYGGSGLNFNVPDYRGMFLRGTGTHGTLAKAAGGNFSGPALHVSESDSIQGHGHSGILPGGGTYHSNDGGTNGSHNSSGNWYGFNNFRGDIYATTAITNNTNGTPRIDHETRPVNYGVNYIIKH